MPINRRKFLHLLTGSAAASLLVPAPLSLLASERNTSKIKAIAFDAFPIFDPRPVFKKVTELFPEKAEALSNLWRTRQFEYTWLRTVTHSYADFWQVTQDALLFATKSLQIELTAEQKEQLMHTYLELKPWPEVAPELKALKEAGLPLCFLSNFTSKMLNSCIESAGLQNIFDHVISTDNAQTYKPDPKAYQLGVDTLGLKRSEILFVAFAGWDAAGAKSFGYPTYWVNRLNMPTEMLGATPDVIARDMNGLANFVLSRH